ncbi:MAG: rod shape-determining protein [Lachnospiraceae bacterium]|nr:rod shape-determining protein [Lachnospiraceae bacterium]
MAQKVYGIDFGTGTIKIYRKKDGIIMNEHNVIATVGKNEDKRPIAMGDRAYEMFEKSPDSIHVNFPMKNGAVADLDDMIKLWDFMAEKVSGTPKLKGSEFYIAVPADFSEVDKRAFKQVVTEGQGKPKNVKLIDKPICDVLGLGIDLDSSSGILVVNMGADTTEISILASGGIIVTKLLPFGGNYFDMQILNYVRKNYNFVIGRRTAENLKKVLVSATNDEKEVTAFGRNVLTGLPGEIKISSSEIYPFISNVISDIAVQTKSIFEHTPPEITHSIKENGIYLTGGSSWVSGMDQFLANETMIKVNSTKHAQRTVISGLGVLVENPKIAQKYALSLY